MKDACTYHTNIWVYFSNWLGRNSMFISGNNLMFSSSNWHLLEFTWLKSTSKLDINNQFEINNHIFVMFSMLVLINQWEIYNILDRFYLDFGKHWLIANYHTLCEWLPSGHKNITKWPPQIFLLKWSSYWTTLQRLCVFAEAENRFRTYIGSSLWREKGKIWWTFSNQILHLLSIWDSNEIRHDDAYEVTEDRQVSISIIFFFSKCS